MSALPDVTQSDVTESYHGRIREDVLSLVPSDAEKVLDVGGGIGANLAFLKDTRKAKHCVLVDLVADYQLPQVDASYAGSLEDESLLGSVRDEQDGFDAILCLDVLEHVTDPWRVVAQCHSMLRPGGVIVASIPNVRNYRVVLPLVLKGQWELQDAGILDRTHLRWFVRDTAIELMTSSGLELEHSAARIYGPKKNLLNNVTLGLFRDFLALQYFIRVRRTA